MGGCGWRRTTYRRTRHPPGVQRLFSFDEALQAGYAPAEIRRHLRCGLWVRLRRNVYAESATVDAARRDPVSSHVLDCEAALRALQSDTVVGDESAALIHGITLLEPPQEVSLTTERPPRSGSREMPGVRVYSATVPSSHRQWLRNLPLTTAARTLVDIARHRSFAEAVVAADFALHEGKVNPFEVTQVLEDCSTWPRIAKAVRVAEFADPACESPLESLSRVCFATEGLPAPQSQVWIAGYRADFLWEEFRTIAEADGLSKYTEPEVLREEKRREDRLRELGFEVVRITWAQVRGNGPEVAARIRAAFARGQRRAAS